MTDIAMTEVDRVRCVRGTLHKGIDTSYLMNVPLRYIFTQMFLRAALRGLHYQQSDNALSTWGQRAYFALAMDGAKSVGDLFATQAKYGDDKAIPSVEAKEGYSVERIVHLPGMGIPPAVLVLDVFAALGHPIPSDPKWELKPVVVDVSPVLRSIGLIVPKRAA